MDITIFFKFPGILILIGVVLLIIAIIIGFIAYRDVDDEYEYEDDEEDVIPEKSLENEIVNNDEIVEEKIVVKEEETTDEVKVPEGTILEDNVITIVPDDNTLADVTLEVDDDANDYVIEGTVIKEDKPSLDDETFNQMITNFDEQIEENNDYLELTEELDIVAPYEFEVKNMEMDRDLIINQPSGQGNYIDNTNDVSYDININDNVEQIIKDNIDNTIDDELVENNDDVLVNEKRVIYGGINPLDNVKLEFNDDVMKPLYGDLNYTLTSMPALPVDEYEVNNDVVLEDDEEIEML